VTGAFEGGPFEPGAPDRITFGVVGPVGQRAFYLQSRTGASVLTLKLEKQQVGALAERLGTLLKELARPGELPEDDSLELEASWGSRTIRRSTGSCSSPTSSCQKVTAASRRSSS